MISNRPLTPETYREEMRALPIADREAVLRHISPCSRETLFSAYPDLFGGVVIEEIPAYVDSSFDDPGE